MAAGVYAVRPFHRDVVLLVFFEFLISKRIPLVRFTLLLVHRIAVAVVRFVVCRPRGLWRYIGWKHTPVDVDVGALHRVTGKNKSRCLFLELFAK